MMGAIYDVDVRTINYHLKKIFSDNESQEDSVIRKFRITAADGKVYETQHYQLAAISMVLLWASSYSFFPSVISLHEKPFQKN